MLFLVLAAVATTLMLVRLEVANKPAAAPAAAPAPIVGHSPASAAAQRHAYRVARDQAAG